jgi:hypothetical protein
MKKFVKASTVKEKEERINKKRLEKFILMTNAHLTKGNFSMNTSLQGIPYLSKAEFDAAVKEAAKAGWNLTQYEDNYNITTYKFEKL